MKKYIALAMLSIVLIAGCVGTTSDGTTTTVGGRVSATGTWDIKSPFILSAEELPAGWKGCSEKLAMGASELNQWSYATKNAPLEGEISNSCKIGNQYIDIFILRFSDASSAHNFFSDLKNDEKKSGEFQKDLTVGDEGFVLAGSKEMQKNPKLIWRSKNFVVEEIARHDPPLTEAEIASLKDYADNLIKKWSSGATITTTQSSLPSAFWSLKESPKSQWIYTVGRFLDDFSISGDGKYVAVGWHDIVTYPNTVNYLTYLSEGKKVWEKETLAARGTKISKGGGIIGVYGQPTIGVYGEANLGFYDKSGNLLDSMRYRTGSDIEFLSDVRLSDDEKNAAILMHGSSDSELTYYKFGVGKAWEKIVYDKRASPIAFSPSGRYVIVHNEDESLSYFDNNKVGLSAEEKSSLPPFNKGGMPGEPFPIISSDSSYLASVNGKTVYLIDMNLKKLLWSANFDEDITGITFVEGKSIAASGKEFVYKVGEDGKILWKTKINIDGGVIPKRILSNTQSGYIALAVMNAKSVWENYLFFFNKNGGFIGGYNLDSMEDAWGGGDSLSETKAIAMEDGVFAVFNREEPKLVAYLFPVLK